MIMPSMLLLLVLAVSCTSSNEATSTATNRVDSTMGSYIDDLEALRDALVEFGNPDGSGGSVDDVRRTVARLSEYTGFFASLTKERRAYVNETYGDELASLLQHIANRAIGAVEISGEAEIAQLVQQIPGLTSTSSETSR
jgi:hypothetical protein